MILEGGRSLATMKETKIANHSPRVTGNLAIRNSF
jgi:hypothetical protein